MGKVQTEALTSTLLDYIATSLNLLCYSADAPNMIQEAIVLTDSYPSISFDLGRLLPRVCIVPMILGSTPFRGRRQPFPDRFLFFDVLVQRTLCRRAGRTSWTWERALKSASSGTWKEKTLWLPKTLPTLRKAWRNLECVAGAMDPCCRHRPDSSSEH